MRMCRKPGIAVIAALLLALHGIIVCAAGLPACTESSIDASPQQEKGCPDHQRHHSGQSHRCLCCESIVCAPRAELTRPGDSSTNNQAAIFAPPWIAILPLNLARTGRRWREAWESPPPGSPVPVFLVHRTLLL